MGRHTFEALKRGASVIAVDLKPDVLVNVGAMAVALHESGEVAPDARFLGVRADALHLPFPDSTFDHVIASEILEHIPDDEGAMAEIARILKPGAGAAVTVPRFWPERVCWALSNQYHLSAGGHVRIYRSQELRSKLARNDLEPVGSHHAHSFHSPYWWLKCAVGVDDEDARLPSLYHRFLVWQLMNRPPLVDSLEKTLDPVLGKSLVVYTRRNGTQHG
jgi:SAM-dependent methyltransferase